MIEKKNNNNNLRFKFLLRSAPFLANMASQKICCLLCNASKLFPIRATSLSVIVRGTGSWETGMIPTHTGQKYDPDDRRLVRFTNRKKEVNPNWAIKLIEEVPPKATKDRVVACDGGGGPLGHPKVYINLILENLLTFFNLPMLDAIKIITNRLPIDKIHIDKPGNHSCGYCGLRFHKEDHHH